MNHLSFYFPRFVIAAIKGLLRHQDLFLPKEPITYQAKFVLTQKNDQKWRDLFSVVSSEKSIPFDYYWPYFQLFFFIVLSKLRINYRNILHLGHDVFFPKDCNGIQVGENVQLQLTLIDIALLDRNRAIVVIESMVTREDGANVCRSVDTLFVKNLNEKNVEELKTTNAYNKTDTQSFLHLTKHPATLLHPTVKTAQFFIPSNFGIQYGKVAGDFNPIHTQPWLAKQFGYPQAFVQGSAMCNFLIKLFIVDQHETLQSLSVRFSRPIHLGQEIQVRFNPQAFEVFNEAGELVIFGERKQQ